MFKDRFIIILTVFLGLSCGKEPSSNLADENSGQGTVGILTIDSGGHYSSPLSGHLSMDLQSSHGGSGSESSHEANHELQEVWTSVSKSVKDFFTAKDGTSAISGKDHLSFEASQAFHGHANQDYTALRTSSGASKSETFDTLRAARLAFQSRHAEVLSRAQGGGTDPENYLGSARDAINSSATAQNTQARRLRAGIPDPNEAPSARLLRSDPNSRIGQSIRNADAYLKAAERKVREGNLPDPASRQRALDVANIALTAADLQAVQGSIAEAFVLTEFSVGMSEFAISLIPGVGWAYDLHGAIMGTSLLSGQKLSDFDRSMAIVGVLTGGLGSKFKPMMAAIAILGEGREVQKGMVAAEAIVNSAKVFGIKTPGGMKVFARIEGAIESLPNTLKVQRIREGVDASKVAIVGRSMGNAEEGLVGVRDAAAHLKSKGLTPSTFEPSPSARNEWAKTVDNYRRDVGNPNAMLLDNMVKSSDLYRENLTWATKLKEEGYTVLDLGNPNGLPDASVFYEMEKSIIF